MPDITPPHASAHAPLLNRLSEMQDAGYYATARATLAEAETVIVQQEADLALLRADNDVLRAELSKFSADRAAACARRTWTSHA